MKTMKTMKMILLAFVLLATACNQSTTTPTTPPANTSVFSLDSTYYIKINFNGQTLHYYSVKDNATGIYMSSPLIQSISPTFFGLNIPPTNAYMQNANLTFSFIFNRVGDTINSPIGAYDLHINGPNTPLGAGAGITDLNTSISYSCDSASTLLNVTSIGATSVTGVVTGKLNNGTTLIPFTGSFCLRKNQ